MANEICEWFYPGGANNQELHLQYRNDDINNDHYDGLPIDIGLYPTEDCPRKWEIEGWDASDSMNYPVPDANNSFDTLEEAKCVAEIFMESKRLGVAPAADSFNKAFTELLNGWVNKKSSHDITQYQHGYYDIDVIDTEVIERILTNEINNFELYEDNDNLNEATRAIAKALMPKGTALEGKIRDIITNFNVESYRIKQDKSSPGPLRLDYSEVNKFYGRPEFAIGTFLTRKLFDTVSGYIRFVTPFKWRTFAIQPHLYDIHPNTWRSAGIDPNEKITMRYITPDMVKDTLESWVDPTDSPDMLSDEEGELLNALKKATPLDFKAAAENMNEFWQGIEILPEDAFDISQALISAIDEREKLEYDADLTERTSSVEEVAESQQTKPSPLDEIRARAAKNIQIF